MPFRREPHSIQSCIILLGLALTIQRNNLMHAAKFCGTDEDDVQNTCWQPCGGDSDCCSLGQRCYEAGCDSADLSGESRNFCGVSWCDAAYKCSTPCPNQDECPEGESCWANTPCGNSPPPPLPAPPTTASSQFCGTSVETATDYCWQPCPRGDSDCCLGLTCFDTGSGTCNADYTGAIHFYCGKSWCDAAYSCQDACPGGSNDECPDGSYCYADVPCIPGGPTPPAFPPTGNPPPPGVSPPSGAPPAPQYKYCGKDYADATSRCWQPCQSNSDCCFEQSCFDTGSGCGPPFYDGPNHSYCGTSLCDAVTKCSVPCPNGNECPDGELCFDGTPCDSDIPTTQPFYCGLGFSEAADKCWQPCPSGQDSECCFGQTCYDTVGSCLSAVDTVSNHRYCGTDSCDAAYKCATPCPGGTDDECPGDETCFDDTPCTTYSVPPTFEFAYCGTSEADPTADDLCWQPCRDDADCCYEQQCIPSVSSCDAPNFQGSAHFFCGSDFCDASFRCQTPCPTGYDAECPSGQSCFANTPCDAQVANFALPRSAMNLAIQFNAERGIPTNGVLPSAAFNNARLSLASFFFGCVLLLLQAH